MRLPGMTTRYWICAARLAWTTMFGLLVVISILPLNALALVLWVVTVARPLRRWSSNAELALHSSAMVGIVAAAIYFPVKITDKVLDRQVVLPQNGHVLGGTA